MDIDNDGDFDCFLTNHDYSLMIFENDGSGYFTDITESTGMQNTTGFFLQGKFEDFDNDGFVDLLYAGGVAGIFHNNGDNTFSEISIPFNDEDMLHSFGIGDLNHDGFSDIYASYGDGYVNFDDQHEDKIWFNDGNSNNWITVQLNPEEGNQSAIGTKVKIYGDWGVQVREVRSGESYGITNSFDLHFGLGSSTSISSMIIEYTNGEIITFENPGINQFINGNCLGLSISIEGTSEVVLCPGEETVLTATSTSPNIEWSNGSITNSITITEPGNYSVTTTDGNGCSATSNSINVSYYEGIEPIITPSGSSSFCLGESIELMVDNVQEGNTYLWSTNEESTSIEVSSSGTYQVETTDACGDVITSASVILEVLTAPVPDVSDQQLTLGETVTFTSSTENTYWYENENSDFPLFEGAIFTSPVLYENTSYWVQTSTENSLEEYSGGKINNDNDGDYHHVSDYWMYFDAYTDLTIQSFKVYSGSDGTRTIFIEDDQGQEVFTVDIFIPEGESFVEINAAIPAGNNYAIRTVGDPDLWRDASNDGFAYPFNIGDVLSINSTNINSDSWNNYYYYFYEWQVSVGDEGCFSNLVEVHATTDVSITLLEESGEEFLVYPNPFNESITISKKESRLSTTNVQVYNAIGELVFSKNIKFLNNQNNTLDLSKLEQGMYTINIVSNSEISTYKLLKQ